MKKVSIIVPHYNSSDKLDRLLMSIPTKYEKILDIIVVDDKSDQKELQNLREIIKKYQNIKLYFNHTNKKNAGAARNIGLKNLNTEWVLFADADDFFLEKKFNEILKYIDTDNEIIFFNVTSIFEDSLKLGSRHLYLEKLVEEYDSKNNNKIRYGYYVPWGKMIKTKLLQENNIYFDEVIASNDCNFSIKIGYYAKKIEVDLNKVYCVTRDKGSLTTNVSEEVFDCRFNVWLEVNKFIKNKVEKKYQKPMLEYIIKSLNYGNRKFLKILYIVIKEKNKIFPENILNPRVFYCKLKKYFEGKKEIENYR